MVKEIEAGSVAATLFGASWLIRMWADEINPVVRNAVRVPVTGEVKPLYMHLQRDDAHYAMFQPLDAPDRIPAGGVFEWRGGVVPFAVPRGK